MAEPQLTWDVDSEGKAFARPLGADSREKALKPLVVQTNLGDSEILDVTPLVIVGGMILGTVGLLSLFIWLSNPPEKEEEESEEEEQEGEEGD